MADERDLLAELRAVMAEATPGEWLVAGPWPDGGTVIITDAPYETVGGLEVGYIANARAIVALRNAWPRLEAALAQAEADRAELELLRAEAAGRRRPILRRMSVQRVMVPHPAQTQRTLHAIVLAHAVVGYRQPGGRYRQIQKQLAWPPERLRAARERLRGHAHLHVTQTERALRAIDEQRWDAAINHVSQADRELFRFGVAAVAYFARLANEGVALAEGSR